MGILKLILRRLDSAKMVILSSSLIVYLMRALQFMFSQGTWVSMVYIYIYIMRNGGHRESPRSLHRLKTCFQIFFNTSPFRKVQFSVYKKEHFLQKGKIIKKYTRLKSNSSAIRSKTTHSLFGVFPKQDQYKNCPEEDLKLIQVKK